MSAADVAAWTDPVPAPGRAGRGALRGHRRGRDERHRPDPAGPRRAASPAATGATPRPCWPCGRWAPGSSSGTTRRTSATPTPSSSPPPSGRTTPSSRRPASAGCGCCRARSRWPRSWPGGAASPSPARTARPRPRRCSPSPCRPAGSTRRSRSAATSTSRAATRTRGRATSSSPRPTRATGPSCCWRRSARSSPTSRPTTWTTTATSPRSRRPSTGSSDGRPGRASSSSAPTTPARRGCARCRRTARLRTYGRAADADLRLLDLDVAADGTSYTAVLDGADLGRVRIQLPGEHMALNSAAALLSGLELGLPAEGLVEGLARFGGVHRRFELKGVAARCARVRRLRPPPHRGQRAAPGGPRRRRHRPARGGLPAAPLQPHPGVRRGLRGGAGPGRRGRGHGRLRRPRGPGARGDRRDGRRRRPAARRPRRCSSRPGRRPPRRWPRGRGPATWC